MINVYIKHSVLLLSGLMLTIPLAADDQGMEKGMFPPDNFDVSQGSTSSSTPASAAIQKSTPANPLPATQYPSMPMAQAQYPSVQRSYPARPNNTIRQRIQPRYRRPANVAAQRNYQQQSYQQQYRRNFMSPNRQNMQGFPTRQTGYQTPTGRFSNMSPFGNSFSPNSFMNNGAMPTPWTNLGGINPWQNGNNSAMPFFPQGNTKNNKKSWGDVRNIWPDFYTDFTEEMWDKSVNAPFDVGRMPGGWRAPSLSSPDPVTVGDAVTNQFPPMLEEMGNMMNFSN